jgi:GxxExxY protein
MNPKSKPQTREERQPLLYEEDTRKIIGAAMEVHNQLGCGFLEAVYQEALEREFQQRGIPFVSQCNIQIDYKGVSLSKTYLADLVVDAKIIVELKAMDALTAREEAQIMNYLKASGMRIGLLINFGNPRLEWKRRILTPYDPKV